MINITKSKAYTAALAHFQEHAAALKDSNDIKRQATSVGNKLEELASAAKPDFSKVSTLHFERQHLADRLLKTTATLSRLEDGFQKPGEAIYHEVGRFRSLAMDAAQECARARLSDDFSAEALEFVLRLHPIVQAEDKRDAFVFSPRDTAGFSDFVQRVPEMITQIELCERRIAIYQTCTENRALPDQKKLDALTPESAKPARIAPRRELSAAEQRERDEALMSAETRRIRELYHQAKDIAGQFGENIDELHAFIAKHPEIARFFPQKRLAA